MGLSAAALADELLGAYRVVGDWVGALDPDDASAWAALRPALASLSLSGRRTAAEIAEVGGLEAPAGVGLALTAAEPVVWARELGAVQRLLWRLLRDIDSDDGRCVAPLTRGLRRVRAVSAEFLAGAPAAVARVLAEGPLTAGGTSTQVGS